MIVSPLYHFLHAIGIFCVFLGIGKLGSSENYKCAMRYHGIGLLILLVSGFGNLAKLHKAQFIASAMPGWAIAKLVIWLVLGVLPVLIKRGKLSAGQGMIAALLCGAAAAYLGTFKPF